MVCLPGLLYLAVGFICIAGSALAGFILGTTKNPIRNSSE